MDTAAARHHLRLAVAAAPPTSLPTYLTSFVGRDRELHALKSLLARSRAITLTGSGGAGKTRLAVEVARTCLSRWPDGAWWVDLAPLNDPHQLPGAVVAAIGLPAQGPAQDTVMAWLAAKRAVLLLDNSEHLIEACARFCDAALKHCPELTVIATSREPLGVPGEARLVVSSLTPADAVRLFEARGRLALAGFKIGRSNLDLVTEICRRVDGLPLAIELAAARLGMLTEQEIVSQLADRFGLLTTGPRTAPDRQQTMRAAIDWSHRLLTEDEARLFRRLSVFRGGFTLESAQAVCNETAARVLSSLTTLVQKSMVEVERTDGTTSRYRLLESMRAYAEERLLAAKDDAQLTFRRHYEYFLHALNSRSPNWAQQTRRPVSVADQEWARREWDNLWAALMWARQNAEDLGLSLAVDVTMSGYGDPIQARNLLLDLLDHSPAGGILRARALRRAAVVTALQGDAQAALSLAKRSAQVGRQLGDPQELAYTLNTLGQAHQTCGELDAAARAFDEAILLANRGGNRRLAAAIRISVGELALQREDYGGARDVLTETVSNCRSAGNVLLMAGALASLAQAQLVLADHQGSAASWHESLVVSRDFNDRVGIIVCLAGFSLLASARGDHRRALRLGAAANRMSGEFSLRLDPWVLGQLERSERQSRTSLGSRRSDAASNEGWNMTLERAIDYALTALEPEADVAAGPLSHREREVVRLIAAGMTNRQIADQLFIAERTAEGHVERIRNKLGVRSRTEVATWAVESGHATGHLQSQFSPKERSPNG